MINSYRKSAPILWNLVRPEWPTAVGIFLTNLAAAVLEGSTLALLALALQKLAQKEEALFLLLILCGVGAQVLKSGFQFSATALTASLEAKVHARTYGRIFEKILHLPFERVSRYRLGDLTDYLAQANQMSDLFLQSNLLLRNLLMVAAYGLLLCWLSLPTTLVALAGYAAVSGLLRRIVRVVSEHSSHFTRSVTELSRQTAEHLQGIRVVHTFARQEQAITEVNSLMQRGAASRCRATAWGAAIEPAMEILTVLGAALLLILGAWMLGQGGADRLPRLLALLLALYRMTPRLGAIHSSITVLATRVPNLRRIVEILQEPAPLPSSPRFPFSGLQSEVAFQNVTLRYTRGEAAAVENLSFLLPKGSFTALVGISGAGKSTVADLLLKLYDPTAGRIEVDGVDLKEIDAAAWRNRLGVVAQEPFLFHATLGENIAYGKPGASRQEIETAARAAHAHGFISQLEKGYDTFVGDRGYRLSGGQRQRIALARALIRRPDLLILDEATSALDSESEQLIQQALDEQRGARTLLVIAHRLSTVRRADRILVLDGGHLAEQGTHPELLDRSGIYARFWRLQSEEIPEIAGAAR